MTRKILNAMRPAFLAAAALLCSCAGKPAGDAAQAGVSLEGDRIKIPTDSRLLGHLEIITVAAGEAEETGLRAVGQIIAIANPPAAAAGRVKIDWVELDPELSKIIELDLRGMPGLRLGDAIGVTQLTAAYARKVMPGQNVNVSRYGLEKSVSNGTVIFTNDAVRWGDDSPVVFKMSGEDGWLPGASCEVTFPLIHGYRVKIPTTALLHEGVYEYVLREVSPGEFAAGIVTVGEGTPEETDIVMGIHKGDRIIARGAILLKPFLHRLLAKKGDSK